MIKCNINIASSLVNRYVWPMKKAICSNVSKQLFPTHLRFRECFIISLIIFRGRFRIQEYKQNMFFLEHTSTNSTKICIKTRVFHNACIVSGNYGKQWVKRILHFLPHLSLQPLTMFCYQLHATEPYSQPANWSGN